MCAGRLDSRWVHTQRDVRNEEERDGRARDRKRREAEREMLLLESCDVPELEQRESTARHTGDSTRTCLTEAHQLVGLYGCLYGTLKDRRNEGLDVLACSTSVGERR